MRRAARKRSRWLHAALLAGACLFAQIGTAHADAFDGADIASEAELADARGGFLTADGVAFDLGAIISTYQDGQLALQTQLTWTPTGAVATHIVGDQYASVADAALAATAALTNGGIGVTNASGSTRIYQGADANSLHNLVVTSGNDLRLAQDIQVTLTLPGFEAMQRGIAFDQLGIRLGAEVNDLLAAAAAGN